MTLIDQLHQRMIDFEQYAATAPVHRILYFTVEEWQNLMLEPEFAGVVQFARGMPITAVVYGGFTLRLQR